MDYIITKEFHNFKIRLIIIDGKEWFFAKDVANVLGYIETAKAVRTHCKNFKSFSDILEVSEMDTLNLQPILGNSWKQTKLIQEPDIWRLIIKSKLPEAERIERWIFEEVLPSIRKTGSYSTSEISQPQKRTNLISVSTEEMRKEFEALEFALKNSNISESEKQFLINQVLQKINFANLEKLKEYKEVFTLTQLLLEFQVGILPHNFNWKLRNFGILKFSENSWILLDSRFGRNCPFENKSNPKYYKSSFQELLDIVLEN